MKTNKKRLLVQMSFYTYGDTIKGTIKEAQEIKELIHSKYDNVCSIDDMHEAVFGSLKIGRKVLESEVEK